eukprot:TRINITY_DN2793_c0_g1_i1.p1 TRINITY_DN2793_c0_g1~~TRINITY_DN2793_c0_g1_i1.p1  ORF type:complete len:160 (-),score=30.14 TRINITY_DN2793_c0_g1_i1:10-489(-)
MSAAVVEGKEIKKDEDDGFDLPKAVIQRIVKSALPDNVQVQKDAKTAINQSAKIFISYLTACANDFAMSANRRTLSGNDVINAMEELEFLDHIPKAKLEAALSAFLADSEQKKKEKKDKEGKDKSKTEGGDGGDQGGAEDDTDEPMPVPDDDELQPSQG